MGLCRTRKAQGVLLGALLLLTSSCGRFDARMALKEANRSYNEGKYDAALESYAKVQPGYPERVFAALNSGYSHMAQYRFGSKHEKDREAARKAVEFFDEYMKIRPKDAKPDLYPDHEKIDEYVITLLVDSERYEEAVTRLTDELKVRPEDPAIMRGIASTYDKWGKPVEALGYFQKWAHLFPKDAAPQVAIAAYCWNMSYRQGIHMPPIERNRWVDNGMAAAVEALKINPEQFEGLTYQNLLLRERAKLRVDPDQVAGLVAQANTILEQAKVLRAKMKEAEEAAAKAKAAEQAKQKAGGAS